MQEPLQQVVARNFLNFVQQVVESCHSQRLISIYSHNNLHDDRELQYNCYGFVGYLLSQYKPEAYAEVVKFMEDNTDAIPYSLDGKPCPFHYAAFFMHLSWAYSENNYWAPVDLKNVQAGDFMVYLPSGFVPKEITRMPKRKPLMHIMIIESIEWQQDTLEMSILDCTREPHGGKDSRKTGGIGRAPLTVILKKGKTYIRWNSGELKILKDLTFGRLR